MINACTIPMSTCGNRRALMHVYMRNAECMMYICHVYIYTYTQIFLCLSTKKYVATHVYTEVKHYMNKRLTNRQTRRRTDGPTDR